MSSEPLEPRRLSDADRARLGEPPGRAALEASLRERQAEAELEKIQSELDEVESYRMPLMEHLIELRDRVIKAVLALAIGCGVGFAYSREVFEFLQAPFVRALSETQGVEGGLSLVNSPFEGFVTYFKVAFIAGLALSMPVIAWQGWQFIAPGLYKTERNVVLPLTISSVGLFAAGATFCYALIFPYAFPFFINVLGVDVNLSVNGYLSSVIHMMVAFGACFQIPVGAFFLARIGLIDHHDMWGSFRYAVIVIFIVAAIITPPDIVTQTMIGLPMVGLYLIGIMIARIFTTKVREPVSPG